MRYLLARLCLHLAEVLLGLAWGWLGPERVERFEVLHKAVHMLLHHARGPQREA